MAWLSSSCTSRLQMNSSFMIGLTLGKPIESWSGLAAARTKFGGG